MDEIQAFVFVTVILSCETKLPLEDPFSDLKI